MRKNILLISLLVALIVLLASCGSPEPVQVEVTRVVTESVEVEVTRVITETVLEEGEEVEVTRIVTETEIQEVEVVVEVTPVPASEESAEEISMMGFPRSQTVFAQQLTERNSTPNNFNSWAGWRQRDRGMQQVMHDQLWITDFESGEIIDNLAAGPAEYNEDFTELMVKIREGVYWSDGEELTAEDVAFTVNLLRDAPGANYNSTFALQVDNAEAVDETTTVIKLKVPNPRFHYENLTDLWGSMWIMPEHVFSQFVVDGEVAVEDFLAFEYNPPLSSGPYKLHSFDEAGFWTAWEKREDWDRTSTGMQFGEPVPQYVVYVHYGDFTARVIAMTRHEVDMVDLNLPAIRAVTGADEYARGYFAETEFPWLQSNRHPGVGGVVFNTVKPPFDNPEVRWALQLAIDPVSYMQTAYDGAAALNPLPMVVNAPQMEEPYIEPLMEWLETFELDLGGGETVKPWDPTAPRRLVEEAWARGFEFPDDDELIKTNFGYGAWKYDPDAAAKLLVKNGFSQDENGKWLLPDGTPWTFTVYTQDTPGRWAHQNASAAYTEWQRFGLDVTFVVGEAGQLRLQMGDFDVGGTQTHCINYLENPDLYRTFSCFHTDFLTPELGERQWGHFTRWTHPRIDQIVDEIRVSDTTDYELLQPLGLELLQLYVQELPAISGTTSLDPYAVSDYYWEGWPSGENPFIVPYHHYPNFKFLLTQLEPTGR